MSRLYLANTMKNEVDSGRADLWVDLDGVGDVRNNTLHDLYRVLLTNIDPKSEGNKTTAELMRELLNIALDALQSTDVYEACFADKTIVLFTLEGGY